MPSLDPELLRRLVHRHLPNLRFADLERYYPIRAESWLGHATSAPWDHDPDDVAGLPVDPHLRGTALFETDDLLSDLRHSKIAGPPNADDTPLRLLRDRDPDSIGNPAYSTDKERDRFLSFGGWKNPDNPAAGGDLDYLYDAFSELASALDHRLAWHPLEGRANRPRNAHPQPPSPAVYCEVDWAGTHPRRRTGDFAPGSERFLDGYLQLTYHYFFAARAPLAQPPQPGLPPLEGQWAAISLFIPATISAGDLDDHGRPKTVTVADDQTPQWIAFSHDPAEPAPSSRVYPFDPSILEIYEDDTIGPLVAAYVGAGSHRFLPRATGEAARTSPEPWPELHYEPGSDFEGLSIIVFPVLLLWLIDELFGEDVMTGFAVALLLAFLAGLFLATIATLLILAALLALILLWLLWNWISEAWDEDHPAQVPHANDERPIGQGASAGDPVFGPAAPSPTPAGDGPGGSEPGDPTGSWPTNAGSPDGWDVTHFDVMVISQFLDHQRRSTSLAPPAWWDYSGRWGIKIPNRADSEWSSGTRRTDRDGRSWGYWHAHELMTELVRLGHTPPTP